MDHMKWKKIIVKDKFQTENGTVHNIQRIYIALCNTETGEYLISPFSDFLNEFAGRKTVTVSLAADIITRFLNYAIFHKNRTIDTLTIQDGIDYLNSITETAQRKTQSEYAHYLTRFYAFLDKKEALKAVPPEELQYSTDQEGHRVLENPFTGRFIDRGFFGWLYDRLLDLADHKRKTFKENTELIVQMKETLPAREVESVSGALYGIVKEREMLLNEIYSWQENEIKEKTELLFSGKLMSRTEDVSCLVSGRCPYPTEDKCMLCRYSIPTAFSLTMAGDELKRLLTEFGKTNTEDVIDRINLTYQIGKLVVILKEAIDRFGYEYIETYIDYKEINELIKKETPNMIFLEDIQNDRK